jgi:hypothetical protein
MDPEKKEKEIAYHAIISNLEKALEECLEFEDLKIFPGENIKNLISKVSDQMIHENWTEKKD